MVRIKNLSFRAIESESISESESNGETLQSDGSTFESDGSTFGSDKSIMPNEIEKENTQPDHPQIEDIPRLTLILEPNKHFAYKISTKYHLALTVNCIKEALKNDLEDL
ncbi:hypothetical protein PanWU01x14_125590 [Parasponia andersonii]|uniref:Uncharacterized protein n=1 Tax=Parasponia andersonii TaxID=3476 RepID=A0A2P5CT68_PARAD|nr:hypothetical protein PanWU01x14_125590 [Parasponia andersonii]